MSDDSYHQALTRTLKAEEAHESELSELELLEQDYPGVSVERRPWMSNSGGGGTTYKAVWHGYTVSDFSIPGLREKLSKLPQGPGGPGGPSATG